jgi:hypothetical protein
LKAAESRLVSTLQHLSSDKPGFKPLLSNGSTRAALRPGLNDIDRTGIQPNFAMFPGFAKAQEELSACKVPTPGRV